MILMIQQLAAGNALRVVLTPPVGASALRLLRKDADTFVDENDPTALIVSDELAKAVTDYSGLINGETVWYKPYYLIGTSWIGDASVSAVPGASFEDLGVDVQQLVRDRLEVGFKVFVDRGDLIHDRNFIPVMKASPQAEAVILPVVTVHMDNSGNEVRAIGELIAPDTFNTEDSIWESFDGMIDRVSLLIVCWSLNSDERVTMRKALRAILNANLEVFDAAGLIMPQWAMSDIEDYETYSAPMYQTVCQFSCLAPAAIKSIADPIADVTVAYSIL